MATTTKKNDSERSWRDVQRESEAAAKKSDENTDTNPAHQDIVNAAQVGRTNDEDLSVGLTLEEQREQGVAEEMRKNAEDNAVQAGSEDPDDSFLRPEGLMPEEEARDNRPSTGELTSGDNGTDNSGARKSNTKSSKSSK